MTPKAQVTKEKINWTSSKLKILCFKGHHQKSERQEQDRRKYLQTIQSQSSLLVDFVFAEVDYLLKFIYNQNQHSELFPGHLQTCAQQREMQGS